jgi:hypothetical protein
MKLALLAFCLLTSNLFSQVLGNSGSFPDFALFSESLNGNDKHQTCGIPVGGIRTTDPSHFEHACISEVAKHTFLLEYGRSVKCTDCSYSLLMVCGSQNPDCNTPWVTKLYFEWFSTKEDALRYMEDNPNFIFQGLFQAGEVKVSVKEERVEEKQLPVYKTVKHYQLEDPNRVGQGRR